MSGPSISQVLGGNIRDRRKALGYNQETFGRIIGIRQQSLSAIERGEAAPRVERLPAIAQVLDCEVFELFLDGDWKVSRVRR